MHGLLVVDKPSGLSSHDVVARLRRVLRETRIGHTGTLDPMATGILLMVVGKATRLAKFLSASDKSYDAVVRFGFATDTADAMGQPIGSVREGAAPSGAEIDAALDAFRGTFRQQPPAFSAKKIDGQRSYQIARAARRKSSHAERSTLPAHPAPPAPPALPAPATVTAHAIRIVSLDGDRLTLQVDCSAGFYIRSLAHDLGERLGVGAHLTALRRTRVGGFGLDRALTLEAIERDPQSAASGLIPPAGILGGVPAITLTAEGVVRAVHGRDLGPQDIADPPSALSPRPFVYRPQPFSDLIGEPLIRLLDATGELVAIAQPTAGSTLLHPSVVLV